jgi:predicted dehydrogenase
MTRRKFLQTGAALSAATFVPTTFAQEKALRVGLIGTGWYGKCDLLRLIQVAPVDVVSLCDVDRRMLADAATLVAQRQKSGKQPRTYGDYRKMLAEKDLDVVVIGTPDHWHALPMIEACKAGADIYVQKPTGVDIVESQAMVAAARKYGRTVQVGTQRRSTPHLIEARDRILREGKLGNIAHVEICCYWHMRARDTLASAPDTTAPEWLDYDMWTGPAPMRPYNKMVHPRGWRAFMEYGNGIVGDMCIHMLDTVRWLLGLGWPVSIASSGGILIDRESRANVPDTQTATFAFPEMSVTWQHRTWGTSSDPDYPWGFKIYGDKGTLCGSTMRYDFIPVGKGERVRGDVVYEREQFPEDLTEKDIELHAAPATRLHMKDLLDAIDGKRKPVADIGEGHISTASCIMANLSMQLGRPISYDPQKMVVPGDKEATGLLRRKYRQGWTHPEP